MVKRNPCFTHLSSTYLFPEINRRKKEFLEQHPDAALISLGVGDTTEPLPPFVSQELVSAAKRMGTREGYIGYGPEHGLESLRHKIAQQIYHGRVHHDDIFISDGAKCDIGRLQHLFGSNVTIAVQDPAYPVYVDGSLLHGVKKITYLPCLPENDFFPDWSAAPKTDLIYFCSPNNPTGAVATHAQLKELVDHAKKQQAVILFDSAYASYIQDANLPRSIFEIDGADEVAIEIGSFSKLAGFSGLRLGWTVVSDALRYADGGSVKHDWKRLTSTIFNGASIVTQLGGLAVLENAGMREVAKLVDFYLGNAALIKSALQGGGLSVFGGRDAPYLWARFPGRNSWDVFQELLEKAHLITTPGSGFGPAGDEFVRFSAFGHRAAIELAVKRLQTHFCK